MFSGSKVAIRATPIASFSVRSDLLESQPNRTVTPPLWTWLLLLLAIIAVSSAGPVFVEMKDVLPLTLSSWRLGVGGTFLVVLAVVVDMPRTSASVGLQIVSSTGLLLSSGTLLAMHFAAWVYSTQVTSLVHSLVLVSATPIIIAAWRLLKGENISNGEFIGTLIGLCGTLLLAVGATSEREVTLKGDSAALVASSAFAAYLFIGQKLRKWIPLFLYASIVTLIAASELSLAAMIIESAGITGEHGLLGWITSKRYAFLVVYLGLVPNLIGHTGVNALLKHISPLIISLGLNMEPLLGGVFGWLLGLSAPPGLWTYLGGVAIGVSTVTVSIASHIRRGEVEYIENDQQEYVVIGEQQGDLVAISEID